MRIDIRISVEQKEQWQRVAKSEGITLTKLIVDTMDSVHTGKGSRVDTGKGTVHTSSNNGGIEGEDVVHTDSRVSSVKKEVVKPRVVKEKVVEYGSGKKEEIKSVDTGKKGLPSQEVDGFKTFFKK